MPNPFPGMNPYLENPTHWSSVHSRLIVTIATALNAELPPHYLAEPEEWVQILPSRRRIQPDVTITERPPLLDKDRTVLAIPRRAVAPPLILEEAESKQKTHYVNIVRAADPEEVVTTIELLSPTNKRAGTERRAYLKKQYALLESTTHLVEIDLLREGMHTVAMPLSTKGDTHWDYRVCLHRAGTGRRFEVWPNNLPEILPCVAVPLSEGDPDVALDLQEVLNRCYEEGAFDRRIDYTQEPIPPLKREDRLWADALLREKGLRDGIQR